MLCLHFACPSVLFLLDEWSESSRRIAYPIEQNHQQNKASMANTGNDKKTIVWQDMPRTTYEIQEDEFPWDTNVVSEDILREAEEWFQHTQRKPEEAIERRASKRIRSKM